MFWDRQANIWPWWFFADMTPAGSVYSLGFQVWWPLLKLGLFFSIYLRVPERITLFLLRDTPWPYLGDIASSPCIRWALLWAPVSQWSRSELPRLCPCHLRHQSRLYISAGSWPVWAPFSLPKPSLGHLGLQLLLSVIVKVIILVKFNVLFKMNLF